MQHIAMYMIITLIMKVFDLGCWLSVGIDPPMRNTYITLKVTTARNINCGHYAKQKCILEFALKSGKVWSNCLCLAHVFFVTFILN